jgi:opacity protein-like surface antigen
MFVMAGLVATSPAALAQGSNWYIAGSAGALFMGDSSRNTTFFNGLGQTAPGTNTTTYNPGESFGLSLGYRLPLGLRAEAEAGYDHFTVKSVDPLSSSPDFPALNGTTLSNPSGGGHDRYTVAADLFYDFPISPFGVTPYVGTGAGYYHGTATDAVFLRSNGTKFTQINSTGDNAFVLAEIGAAVPLTPQLSLVPAYRYEYFLGSNAVHNANIIKVGLRYSF